MKAEDTSQKNEPDENKRQSKLVIHWKCQLAAITGDSPKELTPRKAKQLKLLYRSFGMQTKEVVDWALNNWWKFAHEAMYQAGLTSCPPTPHMGFLLAHHAVAVNLMQSIAHTPKPVPAATPAMAVPVKVPKKLDLTPHEWNMVLDGTEEEQDQAIAAAKERHGIPLDEEVIPGLSVDSA
jgi:hypothetical protein